MLRILLIVVVVSAQDDYSSGKFYVDGFDGVGKRSDYCRKLMMTFQVAAAAVAVVVGVGVGTITAQVTEDPQGLLAWKVLLA